MSPLPYASAAYDTYKGVQVSNIDVAIVGLSNQPYTYGG